MVVGVRGAVPAVAVSAVISACAATSSAPTAVMQTPTTTPSAATPVTAEQVCRDVLGQEVLLDWAPGTVAQFRAYRYGGPKATVPLAHAFPGLSGDTRGAWCGTKGGRQATHWWAAVAGQKAASVITIHGPGEGVRHGLVAGPPTVP
jgi:hypothetical protein